MKLKKQVIAIIICSILILNFILIFLPVSASDLAQDPLDVKGTVSGTWTKSHGPYYIEGDVVIPFGNTLNIEPGVEVYFNGSYSIFVEGTLNASGIESDRIIFSSNFTFPSAGDWNRIQFNTTGKGKLDYCNISYGSYSVYLYNASDIAIMNSSFNTSVIGIRLFWTSNNNSIYNCSFQNHDIGISLYYYPFNNSIRKCKVYGNGAGIEVYYCNDNIIEDCDIYDHYFDGIAIITSTNITINNCDIYWNVGGTSYAGIRLDTVEYIDIKNTDVFTNTYNGIDVVSGSFVNIINCDVFNNYDGIYIYNADYFNIYNCEIYNNDAGCYFAAMTNSHIKNCEVRDNYNGMSFYDSYFNDIELSNFTDHYEHGIKLYFSNYNNIFTSNISRNGDYGIEMDITSNNNITDCNISFNELCGISLTQADSNNIRNCNFLNEKSMFYSLIGIEILENSNYNTIYGCNIFNYTEGIILQNCEYNTVNDCDLNDNYIAVEVISAAAYNTFDNLRIKYNSVGALELHSSDYNIVKNCDISYNYKGIYIINSKFNEIKNSTINYNNFGIEVSYSRDTTIYNTKVKYSYGNGLFFSSSNYNDVIDCNISYNQNYGFVFHHSISNSILNSDIYMNAGGIYVYDVYSLDIIDSAITTYYSFEEDLYFVEDFGDGGDTASYVVTLNTTFDRDKVHFEDADDSLLYVMWYLNVKVVDQQNNPLEYIPIYIWNQYEGYDDRRLFYSGTNGWVRNIICTDYVESKYYLTDYNPHTLSGSIPSVGTTEKEVIVDHTQDLVFMISPTDLVPTSIRLSTEYPIENEWISINASIYNNNPETLYDISVRFIIFNEYFDIYSTTKTIAELGPFETMIESIMFNFTQTGDYTIEVIVDYYNHIEESNESNNQLIKDITVYQQPQAVLEVSSTPAYIGEPVIFYGNKSRSYTGTIISYIFDFGDGSATKHSISFMTEHTYDAVGLYRATLKILDDQGKKSAEASIFIDVQRPVIPNQIPIANFTVTPTWGYVNTSFKFESTSMSLDENGFIDSYRWDFGDNQTSSWLGPSHRYDDDRTYIVSLVVWDDDGDRSDYCNKTVRVRNLPPIANLTVSRKFVEVKDAIEFDASGTWDPDDSLEEISSSFTWDFGDGSDPYSERPTSYLDGAYDGKTIHSYSKPGIYNVTLTVIDDNGAKSETRLQIIVNGTATPSGSGEGATDSWFSGNTVWVVMVAFIVAIVLAVMLLVLYRKKKPKESAPSKPRATVFGAEYADNGDYGAGATSTYPEAPEDIKPKELEISAHDELSPTAISPVRRKSRKKGKKGKKKKKPKPKIPKIRSEEPEFKEEDEEEVEWDMEDARLEELESKKTATTIEYPEPEPEEEAEWEPEAMETVSEIEPEGFEPINVKAEDTTEPVRLSTMPAVSGPAKARCRWCEREISGKYIKGRRKKDPKTGDEYYVEGPFCSMKCSEEFIK
ncbi:MAG: right-handed parallel beta-helix repeat-containing protein [Thermoplasmata archaeon]|nr:right-handed parallel beta-helix repeat-containing protein [Thermoplasmata archaeon]